MSETYHLKNVFSRGMPTVTYVGREHLGLENELRNAVSTGHAIIAVTGPSKCGKTVLRRTVIPENTVVHVEGGQISCEDDFWETIRAYLEAPASTTNGSTESTGSSRKAELFGGLSFLRASVTNSESLNSARIETRNFNGPQKGKLLKALSDGNDVLVIDDFHYISASVRSQIVRALKSAVFDGLTAVMLSVPYRAFDVLAAEDEMEGRFRHLTITPWDTNDLVKISQQGFPALGLTVPDHVQERFACESLGSPLLMQSLCAQLCSQSGVFETDIIGREIVLNEIDLQGLFKAVAKDFGLPAFTKLSAGPQTRTDRIPRLFSNGTQGDMYQAVLAAIAVSGAEQSTPYDSLRAALRDVLAVQPPQKHEVTRAIQNMCKIAKEMQTKSANARARADLYNDADDVTVTDVPAIDWNEDTLQINDVFLRFFLRWIHRQSVMPNRSFV